MTFSIFTHFISTFRNCHPEFYKEGRIQRLKRDAETVRDQDKNAIAADNWYLPHNFGGQ